MFYPQKDHCLALPQPGTDLRSSSSSFLDLSFTTNPTLSLGPLFSALSLYHSDQSRCLCVGDLWFPHPKHKSGYFILRSQARVEVSSLQEPTCMLESSATILSMLLCEGVLSESFLVPLQSSCSGLRGLRVILPFLDQATHPTHLHRFFKMTHSSWNSLTESGPLENYCLMI